MRGDIKTHFFYNTQNFRITHNNIPIKIYHTETYLYSIIYSYSTNVKIWIAQIICDMNIYYIKSQYKNSFRIKSLFSSIVNLLYICMSVRIIFKYSNINKQINSLLKYNISKVVVRGMIHEDRKTIQHHMDLTLFDLHNIVSTRKIRYTCSKLRMFLISVHWLIEISIQYVHIFSTEIRYIYKQLIKSRDQILLYRILIEIKIRITNNAKTSYE